jgi:hypothetical protein
MTTKTSWRLSQTPALAFNRSQQEECYVSQRQRPVAASPERKREYQPEVSHAWGLEVFVACCSLLTSDKGGLAQLGVRLMRCGERELRSEKMLWASTP